MTSTDHTDLSGLFRGKSIEGASIHIGIILAISDSSNGTTWPICINIYKCYVCTYINTTNGHIACLDKVVIVSLWTARE